MYPKHSAQVDHIPSGSAMLGPTVMAKNRRSKMVARSVCSTPRPTGSRAFFSALHHDAHAVSLDNTDRRSRCDEFPLRDDVDDMVGKSRLAAGPQN
jgi:hypothetical protein